VADMGRGGRATSTSANLFAEFLGLAVCQAAQGGYFPNGIRARHVAGRLTR